MSFFGSRRQVEPPPTPPEPASPRPSLPPPTPPGFETVVGASCTIEGQFASGSSVRIDGMLTGSVEIHGNLLVGETARITADINARNISIAGAVRGNITGRKVQILRTGRVWGDIHAQALTTEEGAFIDGKITMTGREGEAPVPDAPAHETDATAILVDDAPPPADAVEPLA